MTAWALTAEDRLEIIELYARYAWGIDLADEELALSVFADDGWFDHLWQGRVQGHDAIRENLRSLWNDRQHWWYGRQHLMDHFIMDPREEPGEVDVRCFFQILQFNVDYGTNFVFGIGTRQDHVVRRDGRWLFQSLTVNAWTALDQVPWQGELRLKSRPQYQMPPASDVHR
ncbi:nuclear transport factor 2 family protein [Microbacterium sp. 18062]|uniref:nuclear transport factor 2 family protein n=1 Tax=Microbacterium sp. 18062 TaxID=2681410 RepID=UPI00135AC1AE|nr:nuclear transport factor 2 family protein [Microbacterium sp. 18062]